MNSPLRSNLIFWLCFIFTAGYAVLFGAAGYEVSAYVIAAFLFGLGVVVFGDWIGTAIDAFKEGGQKSDAVLAFALCVAAVYAITTRLWALWKLGAGSPEWMDTSWIGQFNAVLLIIFFSGVVLATGVEQRKVMPKRSFIQIGLAIFIAGAFIGAAILLAIRPEMVGAGRDGMGKIMTPASSNLPRLMCPEDRPKMIPAYCRRVAAQ